MTYSTEKVKVGRDAVVIAQLRVDKCVNVYGTSPCTAAIGVTGSQRCFNTCKSCQDIAHFNPLPASYSFSNRPLPPISRSIALAIGGAGGKYTTSYDAIVFPNILSGETWAVSGMAPIVEARVRVISTYVIT